MEINDTLENNCNTIENLKAYLRQKGKNNNNSLDNGKIKHIS